MLQINPETTEHQDNPISSLETERQVRYFSERSMNILETWGNILVLGGGILVLWTKNTGPILELLGTTTMLYWWYFLHRLDRMISEFSWTEPYVTKFKRQLRSSHIHHNPAYTLEPLPTNLNNITWYVNVSPYIRWRVPVIQNKISDWLKFYPVELLEKHLSTIIIESFPGTINKLWSASRDQKTIRIGPVADPLLEIILHHEMVHMIFLHWVIKKFIREWTTQFWEYNGEHHDYAPHPLENRKTYGAIWGAPEDMATIGQYLFSKSGWGTLEETLYRDTTWSIPSILQRKIDTLIRFFEKQSKWKMNKEYFNLIRIGEITNGEDAQTYFRTARK